MNKYLYWAGVAAVIAIGIYASTLVSIQPPTVPKVAFAQFETAEDLGSAAFQSVKEEIKAAPVVLLGVTPGAVEDTEFLRGFLAANQEPGSRYDMIVIEPKLPYAESFTSQLAIDIKDDMERFVEGVKKAREQGLRVAVIVPNIYSSQLLGGNPAMRLKNDHKLDVVSFSVAKFPVTREQEESFEPGCVLEDGQNRARTGELGCMIQHIARKTYKKKFEDGKYSGMMEKLTPTDYLVLLNRNAGSR